MSIYGIIERNKLSKFNIQLVVIIKKIQKGYQEFSIARNNVFTISPCDYE